MAAEPLFFFGVMCFPEKKTTRSTMTKKETDGIFGKILPLPKRNERNSSQKSCCFEEVSGLFLWFETDVWVLLLT